MKYKFAICDDSSADRKYIRSLTEKWAKLKSNAIEISEFSSAENFLFFYEDKNDYDILFLDVEMDKMDGVSLAKKIRSKNDTIQLIFISGYSDYIAEGYEVDALHYLMKPVKEDKFYSVLDRAEEKIEKNERMLYIETGSEMFRIPFYQIRYASVDANYVTIHALSDITVKMTLGDLEKELDEQFFRVSRSEIVNLNYVVRVTKKEIILHDNTLITIPRGAYEKVNRAIIKME